MNDCARIAVLFDVYLDDESTVETNVMVQQHVEHCDACARRLHDLRELRASMRHALASDRAPASLHERVRAMTQTRSPLPSFIRAWIVPAAATAIVAWIVVPWAPAEPDIHQAMAVGEHVACALKGVVHPRDVASYANDVSMPLLPDASGRVRVVDAHACGQHTDYLHVVLEEGGTRASILIARAGEGGNRISRPVRRGAFEVSTVRTTRHHAFIVIDGERSRALREWREPTLRRVQNFLRQVEGT